MTEYISTCDAMCAEQKRERITVNSKSATTIWSDLWRLIGTTCAYAVEIYRWNNDVQPQFPHGGARVLIRPDRIDLA